MFAAALAIVVGATRGQSAELAEPRLVRQLEARVTLTWSGQTLGAALERLSETQQLPLWIDRRVDTSAAVELSANDEPVRDVLSRLAALHDLDATPFRSVVYVGPRQSAADLATLSMRGEIRSPILPPTCEPGGLSQPRGHIRG